MKLSQSLVTIASISFLSILGTIPAFAAPAYLVGSQPGSRVNVRSGPSTSSYSPHYGLVGDRVQVIDSTIGKDGYDWYYVEFISGARGWIRGDFVQVQQPRRF